MANRPRSGRLTPAERAREARRLRDEQRLTQRQIAERLDVSLSTIANDLRAARPTARGAPASAAPRRAPHAAPATTPQGAFALAGGVALRPARVLLAVVRRLAR